MIVDVKIYYCVDNHFPPRRNEIPTEEQFERNWKALPDWVWENIEFNAGDWLTDLSTGELLNNIYRRMNDFEANPLSIGFLSRRPENEEDEVGFRFMTDGTEVSGNPRFGQDWLEENGVDHTSMSVGDIVEINGHRWHCQSIGWKDEEGNRPPLGRYGFVPATAPVHPISDDESDN